MTLRQIAFLREIVRHSLNISAAAAALNTSQPGISRQIQDLERELGTPLFVRTGNRILALTETGSTVLAAAERLLGEAENIRLIAAEVRSGAGRMIVATSHLHARYTLLEPIYHLRTAHPKVEMLLLQASPNSIVQLVATGEADIGVGTGGDEDVSATLPRVALLVGNVIRRSAIMSAQHPLARRTRVSLDELGAQPLIGYGDSSPTGRHIAHAFAAAGIKPNYVVRASNSDVIKAYVAQGLGIGIVPTICLASPKGSRPRPNIMNVDVTALLPRAYTTVIIRRDMYLRRHVVDFIRAIAPAWDRSTIQRAMDASSPSTMLFPDTPIGS